MRSTRVALPLLVFLAPIIFAPSLLQAAGINYLAHDRFVDAGLEATDDINTVSDSQSFSAPDFGPFNSVATAQGGIGGVGCAASGFQRSTLAQHAIHVFESHSAYTEVFSEVGSGWASGASRCNIDFHLDQGQGVTLRGFVESYDNGGAVVILFSGSTEIYAIYSGSNEHLEFDEFFGISAGDYHLTVETSGYANGFPFQSQYSFGSIDVSMILSSATDAPAIAAPAAGRTLASPNPFRAFTKIQAPAGARELGVYDLGGRLVRSWRDETALEWDGTDEQGRAVPAGVYFLRADGEERSESVKLVRVR